MFGPVYTWIENDTSTCKRLSIVCPAGHLCSDLFIFYSLVTLSCRGPIKIYVVKCVPDHFGKQNHFLFFHYNLMMYSYAIFLRIMFLKTYFYTAGVCN